MSIVKVKSAGFLPALAMVWCCSRRQPCRCSGIALSGRRRFPGNCELWIPEDEKSGAVLQMQGLEFLLVGTLHAMSLQNEKTNDGLTFYQDYKIGKRAKIFKQKAIGFMI
ncbi:MAG: hypothetical protein R3B47_07475 [Bacteroidia bacterium]